jgi:4-aminobutyrate aminotransferase-like enzyme
MPLTYKQYLPGNKTPFLDVANNVAGVGHSHPLVVQASVAEMTNIQVDFFSLP